MTPRARPLAVLCLAGVLAAGCAAASPAAAPASATATASILFQDDFSNPNSGWNKETGADETTNYDHGQYLIAVQQPSVDVWAEPGLDLTDVALQVQTQLAGGPVDNEFGVMCRYQRGGDGKNSFYFFLISSDGYYALGKVSKDVRTILSPAQGSPQPSKAIQPQTEAINQLDATCQGSHMALSVNGTAVGDFNDGELTRGDIGLIAGTYDEGGVMIHFDNLVARRP